MSQSFTSIAECPPKQSPNPSAAKKEAKQPVGNSLELIETLMECLCCFITQSSEILQTLTDSLKQNTCSPNHEICVEMVELLSEGLCEFIPKSSDVLQKLKCAIQGKSVADTKDKACSCCPCPEGKKDGVQESQSKLSERRKSDLAKKKCMFEKFKGEKREKLCQIKETMNSTQKTIQCIQEQIRQLERMEVDFDTVNTVDGQVNPAALYKEIMKPNQVPFIQRSKPCVPPQRPQPCPPPQGPCPSHQQGQGHQIKCDFLYQGTIAKPAQFGQGQAKHGQEKVQILSTMPYNKPKCP